MKHHDPVTKPKVFDITKLPMPKFEGQEPTGPEMELIIAKIEQGLFDELPRQLQRWVTSKLLPSMSRYGTYPPPENLPEIADPLIPGVYTLEVNANRIFKSLFPLNPELWNSMEEAFAAHGAKRPASASVPKNKSASAFAIDGLVNVKMGKIGGKTCPVVLARELHRFIGSKDNFSNWIVDQIDRTKLKETKHFVIYRKKPVNSGRGRPNIDYLLTLDAAKHIAMVANTDKASEVRDYFIECEERYYELLQGNSIQ